MLAKCLAYSLCAVGKGSANAFRRAAQADGLAISVEATCPINAYDFSQPLGVVKKSGERAWWGAGGVWRLCGVCGV